MKYIKEQDVFWWFYQGIQNGIDAKRRGVYKRFSKQSFKKFNSKKDPQYSQYKDRIHEEAHDRGYNSVV